jgi:hypothetical protein
MSERFVVRESTGYKITEGKGGSLTTEVLVLDRGYCYRVVWSSLTSVMTRKKGYFSRPNPWRNPVWRMLPYKATARRWPLAERRAYARDLAAKLNAEDAA